VLAVSELVNRLSTAFPQHRVMISTTTDTGQRLARQRFGEENVFYFPLDFMFAVRRWLRALKPTLVVIAETEFWPNFLRSTHSYGAKVAIVNARISDHSFPGYLRWKRLIAPVLQIPSLFLAQTDQDAARLREIGAPPSRIFTIGNLKYDVPPPPAPPVVAELRQSLGGARPVLVCGSTVEGEETLLLGAFTNILANHAGAVMLLAPRHPRRFEQVERLLRELKLPFWRRSKYSGGPLRGGVLLVDTIGELSALYALADIAFVGGSLVPRGGHNIIEPAQHGVPIVVGNHTENFREIVRFFQSQDAVRVVGPAELPLTLLHLIENDAERAALGERAAQALELQRGATRRTLERLKSLLDKGTEATPS
jgi:3-deoxy-D-manno-octulosonic-acid transferase